MDYRPPEQAIPDVYRQTIGPLYAYVSRRCAGERALAETAQDATRQRLLILARIELQAATSDLDLASTRNASLQKQVQVGRASEMDMLKAQLEMLSRKQDVELLRARIAELEKGRSE